MDVWEVGPTRATWGPLTPRWTAADRRGRGRRLGHRGPIFKSPGSPARGMLGGMSDVTRILSAIEAGDARAAEELLPLVYDELRKLAAQKLVHEQAGQTLDATALVHEAYLRLVGNQQFANRRHFFAAAAQAMRRILVESARRKRLAPRVDLPGLELASSGDERLLELHDALERLAAEEPMAARVVEARVFAGLSVEEAAAALGLSRATAYREWTFARAWLATALSDYSEQN